MSLFKALNHFLTYNLVSEQIWAPNPDFIEIFQIGHCSQQERDWIRSLNCKAERREWMHYRNMVHISIFLRVWSGPVNTFLMFRFYRSSWMCAMSSIQCGLIVHRTTGLEGIFFFFLQESHSGRKMQNKIFGSWS